MHPKWSPHANFEVPGLNKTLVFCWPLFQDHLCAWPPWSHLSPPVLAPNEPQMIPTCSHRSAWPQKDTSFVLTSISGSFAWSPWSLLSPPVLKDQYVPQRSPHTNLEVSTSFVYFRIICKHCLHCHLWVLLFWQINIDHKDPHIPMSKALKDFSRSPNWALSFNEWTHRRVHSKKDK